MKRLTIIASFLATVLFIALLPVNALASDVSGVAEPAPYSDEPAATRTESGREASEARQRGKPPEHADTPGRPEHSHEPDRPGHARQGEKPDHAGQGNRPPHSYERGRPDHSQQPGRPEHSRQDGRPANPGQGGRPGR